MRRELGAQAPDAAQWQADRPDLDVGAVLATASDVLDVAALERDWRAIPAGGGRDWVQVDRSIGLAIFLHAMRDSAGPPL
jgi:hypothetical protein